LKIFPNPNNGKFSIELPENHSDGTLFVYDKNGILVQKEFVKSGVVHHESQIKNPIPSSYFIVFEDEKGKLNGQLVVQ
jgi:hypothetical protein